MRAGRPRRGNAAIVAASPRRGCWWRRTGRAVLKAQVEASPVRDAIRFAGRVPHGEVDRYYSLCDVMAYRARRSLTTGHAAQAVEAMAQGKLVAASDVGGTANW